MNRMKTIQILACWVIVFFGLHYGEPFFVPMLLSVLLCFLIMPLTDFLVSRKLSEAMAVTLSSIVVSLPVIGLALFITKEVQNLSHEYPVLLSTLKDRWSAISTSTFIQSNGLSEYMDLSFIGEKVNEGASHGFSAVLEVVKSLGSALTHLFIILFFSIIMLSSRKRVRIGIEGLTGNEVILVDVIQLIERFLIARLGIAGFVALIDMVLLKSFGINYSVLLGILLGMATAIPVIGFILAILPPVVLGFAAGHSPTNVGIMALSLYFVASIESHFVAPKYLGQKLNLNLLMTFVALFAGELLWGIWGMVLSIPILGIIRIILDSSQEYKPWAKLLSEK